MKKIFTLILLLSLIIPLNAQNRKADKKAAKEEQKAIEWLNQRNLKIVNRGLDFNKTFVVFSREPVIKGGLLEDRLEYWKSKLFETGFEVGEWFEDESGLNIQGDYLFELIKGQGLFGYTIKISDVNNNNKLVADIRFNPFNPGRIYAERFRNQIIEKLKQSNK